jgi:CheY-like chemotaxis protein
LGYAQILKREADLSPRQKDGLQIIQQSGDHLLHLINDILDLAKIEAGRIELSLSTMKLHPFLEQIADVIQIRAQQKGVQFLYEEDVRLPQYVHADEVRLRQVLLNLLGNAVKFTDKGTVLLQVSMRENGRIRFSVIDTGIGLDPKEMERIFQPFEQVGDMHHRADGAGLGLAITRQLVHIMGGEVHVQSIPGQGSTFWFEIDLPGSTAPGVSERKLDRIIRGYKGNRRKILVVDDKSHNRMVLLNMLEPLGFEVSLAEDGGEAIRLVTEFKPDLILMDLVMPGVNGFDASRTIRQSPDAAHIIIIAVSASVFESEKEKSHVAGCHDFLPKPVKEEALLQMLADYLQLEWEFEAMAEDVTETLPDIEGTAVFLTPPLSEMTALLDLARRGNMKGIRKKAAELKQVNGDFEPFAAQLDQLAKNLEDREILALIESHMPVTETTDH